MRLFAGLVFAFVTICAPAKADFFDGELLFDLCTTATIDPLFLQKNATCVGYIAGVVDAYSHGSGFCLLPTTKTREIYDLTVKYMSDNPRSLSWSASTLIFAAIKDAFPCNKN